MNKQKYDFQPDSLQASKLATAKAGDVLLIRPQPAIPAEESAAGSKPEQLGCYLPAAPTELVGLAPPSIQHLKAYGELQASIRSVKRDSQGQVLQLFLRIEIREDGPVTYGGYPHAVTPM